MIADEDCHIKARTTHGKPPFYFERHQYPNDNAFLTLLASAF